MFRTRYDGITFVEGLPSDFERIRDLTIEIGGIIEQAQLKSLNDVKKLMAAEARQSGGNAIVDFKYGQRSVGWLRSLWQMDDVNWYGTGIIAALPD
jgi:uncharacterized protein YbjQ (UPF0145 family)